MEGAKNPFHPQVRPRLVKSNTRGKSERLFQHVITFIWIIILFCREPLKPRWDRRQQGQTGMRAEFKKRKKTKQNIEQKAYFTWKSLLAPELMHNNGWPFPSKPLPASLGSGLMGNHGYRPHTSPPFFFLSGEEIGERERDGVSTGTWLSLHHWCLSDHSIFIKLSITMHTLLSPSLSNTQHSWRGINWTQPRLMGSLF